MPRLWRSHSADAPFKRFLKCNSAGFKEGHSKEARVDSRCRQDGGARLAFKQIVKNVHYLHKVCGIVHLDLKMPNILLNAFLLPVLTDFGFAEAGNGEPLQTWKGTEYHISPEMQAFRYN